MKKYLFIIFGLMIGITAQAQTMIVKPDPEKLLRETPIEDNRVRIAPVVSNISDTTAKVEVPKDYNISEKSQSQIYFEYGEIIACPAIYPTPEYCRPKLTNKVGYTTILRDLTPNKKYYVRFVKDSSIKCIKAPCPTDTFRSDITEFTTLSTSTSSLVPKLDKGLRYGTRGIQVIQVQDFLYKKGYFNSSSTSFYGKATEKAILRYQKDIMKIRPTGTVGNQTWTHMFGTK